MREGSEKSGGAGQALRPVITARLYKEGKCFGPGVAMLLRRVRTLRSLRAAAMDMDMAYSKAWTILRNAESQLGVKLLQSRTGGRHGGGAVLTEEGERLLAAYEAYVRDLEAAGWTLFQRYFQEWTDEKSDEKEERP